MEILELVVVLVAVEVFSFEEVALEAPDVVVTKIFAVVVETGWGLVVVVTAITPTVVESSGVAEVVDNVDMPVVVDTPNSPVVVEPESIPEVAEREVEAIAAVEVIVVPTFLVVVLMASPVVVEIREAAGVVELTDELVVETSAKTVAVGSVATGEVVEAPGLDVEEYARLVVDSDDKDVVIITVVDGSAGMVLSVTTFSTVVSLGLVEDGKLVVEMVSSFLVVVGKNVLIVVTSTSGSKVEADP